jgi:hypothetical protein
MSARNRLLTLAAVAAMAVWGGMALANAGDHVLTGQGYTCTGPQDVNLLKVTDATNNDSTNLRVNCTGRYGRIEFSGIMADGIKINQVAPVAHDFVVEGGYIFADGAPAGAHQDGVQAMAGTNITIRNVAFDNAGNGGGGAFFVSGSSASNIVCDHCAFSSDWPNLIRVYGACYVGGVRVACGNGVKNSLICEASSGRAVFGGSEDGGGNLGGNIVVPANDPRCTREGLLAYVSGGTAPPPTTTEPPPTTTPDPPACDEGCVANYERIILELRVSLATAEEQRALALTEQARMRGLIDAYVAAQTALLTG